MKASSNIKAISYNPEKKELTVQFQSGGAYCYGDVSKEEFHAFDNAHSAGTHFHKHIKHKKAIRA